MIERVALVARDRPFTKEISRPSKSASLSAIEGKTSSEPPERILIVVDVESSSDIRSFKM